VQRTSGGIEIDEDQRLPGIDLDRNQAVVFALEILHAVELGHALERAVEAVVPAMIGTMQDRRLSAGLSNDCCSVMPADVEKRAQHAVGPANRNDRLASYCRTHKLTRLFHLIDATDDLPSPAEHRLLLEIVDARVHIPGRRNGVGIGESSAVVVGGEDLLQTGDAHAFFPGF